MTLGLKTLPKENRRVEHAIRANLSAWQNELWRLERMFPCRAPNWSVAISPDGRTCATGSDDGALQLWDMATENPIGEPFVHPSKVWSIVFSPDNKRLFVAHEDRPNDGRHGRVQGWIRVWNLQSSQAIGEPMKQPSLVRSIALSPDMKTLLAACDDGKARFWNVATHQQIGEPLVEAAGGNGGPPMMSVAYSPDGTVAAIGRRTARFWNISQRKFVGLPMKHRFRVGALDFTPDGKTLVTEIWDHTAQRWSVPQGDPIGERIDLEESCSSLAVSPDGRQIALGTSVPNRQLEYLEPLAQPIWRTGNSVLSPAERR